MLPAHGVKFRGLGVEGVGQSVSSSKCNPKSQSSRYLWFLVPTKAAESLNIRLANVSPRTLNPKHSGDLGVAGQGIWHDACIRHPQPIHLHKLSGIRTGLMGFRF